MTKQWQKLAKDGHLWVMDFQDFFFQNWKKNETEKFVFYAVAFDPIKIETCLVPQNDCQHLIFVKD